MGEFAIRSINKIDVYSTKSIVVAPDGYLPQYKHVSYEEYIKYFSENADKFTKRKGILFGNIYEDEWGNEVGRHSAFAMTFQIDYALAERGQNEQKLIYATREETNELITTVDNVKTQNFC